MLKLKPSFGTVILSILSIGVLESPASAQDKSERRPYDWAIDVGYSESTKKRARDIQLIEAGLRIWFVDRDVISVGVKAGGFWSDGQTTEDGGSTYNTAEAVGGYLGLPVRIQANRTDRIQPFAELAISGIATDRNWPDPDPERENKKARFYGKFDVALGTEYVISETSSITASGFLTHISNGRGLAPDNLNYDGVGFMLSFTRRY